MQIPGIHPAVASRIHKHYVAHFEGAPPQTEFFLGHSIARVDDIAVYLNGARQRVSMTGVEHDYRIRGITKGFAPEYLGDPTAIRFTVAPALGDEIIVDLTSV